jgi:type I restriction enzyme R subunit
LSFTKKNSLSEACFEDVVMAALAAGPLYSAREASCFDAATHSRAHAVRYKQELDAVLSEQNLNFGVLVAFSGTVTINEQK